ncbi:hypothetical protein [Devosia ginsengisoli]|uniref:Uncharacterized protein n=1 Tax=Devosia ginsengisoli TaxID=400770 RepID=A0A5B8LVD1_9HYPH|nr:hypothetical protein [Devosia ginsengisoli]QDZ11829.1 hypothetical protein FPZ08_14420 [Devosia ginsengisoli]
MVFPFQDINHQDRFEAGRSLVQRGGAAAAMCGAKTRNGGSCRQPPLKEHTRCLRHAGPKAATEHRDRQWRDVQRGRISWEDFALAELKRAANRLRWRWKKDPWAPGRTIDLGEHEDRFQIELGRPDERGQAIAPAVLDWLRWKFRRMQLDRRRDGEWADLLRHEYPDRVRAAGPAPKMEANEWAGPEPEAAVWASRVPSTTSKRGRLDRVRVRRPEDDREIRAVPRKENPEAERVALARVAHENRVVVAPLIQKCTSEDEEIAFLRVLRACVENPNDQKARAKWIEAARTLSAR